MSCDRHLGPVRVCVLCGPFRMAQRKAGFCDRNWPVDASGLILPFILARRVAAEGQPDGDDVGAEGVVGDGPAVLVAVGLPDGGGADRRGSRWIFFRMGGVRFSETLGGCLSHRI